MNGDRGVLGGEGMVVGVVVPADGMHTTLDPSDKRRAFDEDRQRASKELAEKQAAMRAAQALADRRERIFQAAVRIAAGLPGQYHWHEIAEDAVDLALAIDAQVDGAIK